MTVEHAELVSFEEGELVEGQKLDETMSRIQLSIAKWLGACSDNTIRARLGDLRMLSRFATLFEEDSNPAEIAFRVLILGRVKAEALAVAWHRSMKEEGKQPTTISRRLSTLRSLFKQLHHDGFEFHLDAVRGPKYDPYSRATGPAFSRITSVFEALEAEISKGPRGRKAAILWRDYAIIRLLSHTAMRRSSLCAATVQSFMLGGDVPTLRLPVKGGKSRDFRLDALSSAAIQQWLKLRVDAYGPYEDSDAIFISERGLSAGQALSGGGLYWIIAVKYDLGGPHGIRHSAVTKTFEDTGNLRTTQHLGGWVNAATAQTYMDAGNSAQLEATNNLAGPDPDEHAAELLRKFNEGAAANDAGSDTEAA